MLNHMRLGARGVQCKVGGTSWPLGRCAVGPLLPRASAAASCLCEVSTCAVICETRAERHSFLTLAPISAA